jgi:hypothetical protein
MDKYFGIKSAPFIAAAKAQGGILLELGLSLEAVVADKDSAVKGNRLEAAARYRQQEVELIKQIETLMKGDK